MAHLKIVLLHGASGSGKSFTAERLLGIDYQVTTCRLDGLYAEALEHIGISGGARGPGIYRRANELHSGEHDAATTEAFFARLSELIGERVQEAHGWRLGIVFEGYPLRFAEEARLALRAGQAVAPGALTVARIQLLPSAVRLSLHREAKARRREGQAPSREAAAVADPASFARPPEPVEGIDDYRAADLDEVRRLADERIALRPYNWHQRFTLGPVSPRGRIDASEKLDLVLDRDLNGKRLIDICCNTGVHAIMAKQRGAAKAVGVERNPRVYAKALELKKVLRRHSDLDARVKLLLGDAAELLPTLGYFDTLLFFGALHYFPDYHAILGSVAAATDVAYVEFTFTEGPHDTATAPGAIRPWVRNTGKTIYMGDRETIARTVGEAMPGFEVEARAPVTRRASDREVWRLRRNG